MNNLNFETVLWDLIAEALGDMKEQRIGLRKIMKSKSVDLSRVNIGTCNIDVDRNHLTVYYQWVPIASCKLGDKDSICQFNDTLYEFSMLPDLERERKIDILAEINRALITDIVDDPDFEDRECCELDLSYYGVEGPLCNVCRNGCTYTIEQGPIRIASAHDFGNNVLYDLDYGIWWWLNLSQGERDYITRSGISVYDALSSFELKYEQETEALNNNLYNSFAIC